VPYTEAQLRAIVAEGESLTVELKQTIPNARDLANLIAAFANAEGGHIIIGAREPDILPGVNELKLQRAYEAAQAHLHPRIPTALEVIRIGNNVVGVISVLKSDYLVLTDDGAHIRKGGATRVLTREEMLLRLDAPRLVNELNDVLRVHEQVVRNEPPKVRPLPPDVQGGQDPAEPGTTLNDLLDVLVAQGMQLKEQSQQILNLHEEVRNAREDARKAGGFRAQAVNYVLSGIVGVILSMVIPYLFTLVFR
jgi:hypothetical protein